MDRSPESKSATSRQPSWDRENFVDNVTSKLEPLLDSISNAEPAMVAKVSEIIWIQLSELATHLDLKPGIHFHFDIDRLNDNVAAGYNPSTRCIVINQLQLWKIGTLYAAGEIHDAKADLDSLLAHEMYHAHQHNKFPNYMRKVDTGALSRDHNLYILSKHERAADLFTVEYLRSKLEADPEQQKANHRIANRLERELKLKLITTRGRRWVERLLGRRDDSNG